MLLVLTDEQKKHVITLNSIDISVAKQFCQLSVGFMQNGINPKMYQNASNKLKLDAAVVQHVVEGIMHVLSEASKLTLGPTDFQDSLLAVGVNEEVRSVLLSAYEEHREQIRATLTQISMDLPHYHNLEWRFDIQVASRSLHEQITPLVILKLHTVDNGVRQTRILQCDPVNLLHLTQSLEEALQEAKSNYARRIIRNL